MIEIVEPTRGVSLDDCAEDAYLRQSVFELRQEAAALVPRLRGRTVWMINSTARGGGVAEMLPRMVTMLEELGVRTRWAVMPTRRAEFFSLTKRIHNLVHGVGTPVITAEERQLYDTVSRECADQLRPMLAEDDLLVVHDPQPAGMGALLASEGGHPSVWRCHIGLADRTPQTSAAWQFLMPYVSAYDHAVFSAPPYVPRFLSGRFSIIHPALDPTGHKNRALSSIKLSGVLCNAGLVPEHAPVLTPPFEHPALRLQRDGTFGSAVEPEPVGLLFRPMVTQISRWDRLKGFGPLLEGFIRLKRRARAGQLTRDAREQRRLELVRLVLAGPDPESVSDDPEAVEVLSEIEAVHAALDPDLARDVAILSLPMTSPKYNALMVNALQRASSIVVQNSLQEGFGLVVTEAMWKRTPVLAAPATGVREQLRDGIDGRLLRDATDPEAIVDGLMEMLSNPDRRARYAANAQRRVYDEFLVFGQVERWIRLLASVAEGRRASSEWPPPSSR